MTKQPEIEATVTAPTKNIPFVDDYLLYLLAAVSAKASTQFHEKVRSQGVKISEWRVLACLGDKDGQMITELAKLCLFEQSRLTKTVNQMASHNWVTRASDSQDARRVRVFLTEDGRRLAADLTKDAREHEKHLLEQIQAPEAQNIKPILKALLENFEAT